MYGCKLTGTIWLPVDRPLDTLKSEDDNVRIVFKNIFIVYLKPSSSSNKLNRKYITKNCKMCFWLTRRLLSVISS